MFMGGIEGAYRDVCIRAVAIGAEKERGLDGDGFGVLVSQ